MARNMCRAGIEDVTHAIDDAIKDGLKAALDSKDNGSRQDLIHTIWTKIESFLVSAYDFCIREIDDRMDDIYESGKQDGEEEGYSTGHEEGYDAGRINAEEELSPPVPCPFCAGGAIPGVLEHIPTKNILECCRCGREFNLTQV